MFQRIRERVGSPTRRRYHSGEFNLPEEVSDPHEKRDETKTDRLEYVKDHPVYTALLMIIFIGGVILFAQELMRFGVSFYENRIARLGGGATIIAASAYVAGRRSQQDTYEAVDRLVLVLPNGVKRYHGRYVENDQGEAPLFVPYRGWSWMGRPGDELQIRDVSFELAQSYSNTNRDPDDAVVIRLHPAFSEVSKTGHGTVVGQLSNGLALDPFGKQSNLQATLPDRAEESALESLREELKSARQEIKHEREKITALKRQKAHYREEAKKARREHIGEFIDNHREIREVEYSPQSRKQEQQATVGGPVDVASDTGYDREAIEEELSDDDDE